MWPALHTSTTQGATPDVIDGGMVHLFQSPQLETLEDIRHALFTPQQRLFYAVQSEDIEAIQGLVVSGIIDFDEEMSSPHQTLIAWAIEQGATTLLTLLLENGANPNLEVSSCRLAFPLYVGYSCSTWLGRLMLNGSFQTSLGQRPSAALAHGSQSGESGHG